jgi:hypothetical protein
MEVNKLLFPLMFWKERMGTCYLVREFLEYFRIYINHHFCTDGTTVHEDMGDDEMDDEDDEKDGDQNLAVYDFDEGEEGGSGEGRDSEDEDIKPNRLGKGGMKKMTQTVSQAHMCNYCNYTSPKRLDIQT